jgi:MFS-type transporter involved in bile tolerance (Atg22 family)
MGFYTLVFNGLFPLGSLMIGFLAAALGAQTAIMCGSIVCGATGLLVYSKMRRARLKAAGEQP